jgi:hydroxymethylpyrimidine pyrophosphatase-like HAD family hydrolase
MMKLPVQLLSTDFDGTLHAEGENPPIPVALQELIAGLQAKGMAWVINTGRNISSLLEALVHAQLSIWPDYLVTVEREIHCRKDSQYVALEQWNRNCHQAHEQLFARVRPDVPLLTNWIKARFQATVYEDPYSPFCLIAGSNPDADLILAHLEQYCAEVPHLTVVRNDVYARFSHQNYNKGSALGEISKCLGINCERVAAAGDHLNDLPMLSNRYARWLIAPANAVPSVKEAVRRQHGYVSEELYGRGIVDGLRRLFDRPADRLQSG